MDGVVGDARKHKTVLVERAAQGVARVRESISTKTNRTVPRASKHSTAAAAAVHGDSSAAAEPVHNLYPTTAVRIGGNTATAAASVSTPTAPIVIATNAIEEEEEN